MFDTWGFGLTTSTRAAQTIMTEPVISGQPKGSDRNRALEAIPVMISPVNKNDKVVGVRRRADQRVAIRTGPMYRVPVPRDNTAL